MSSGGDGPISDRKLQLDQRRRLGESAGRVGGDGQSYQVAVSFMSFIHNLGVQNVQIVLHRPSLHLYWRDEHHLMMMMMMEIAV